MNSKLLKALWALAFAVGLFCVAARFFLGKDLAAYNSYIPWGLWVAVYIYFVGMSAGAYLLSTSVTVFRIERLQPIARLSLLVSFSTLVGALVTIFMDLGRPFRFWKVYLSPSSTSMMTLMIWLYTAYIVLLVVQLRLAARADLVEAARRPGWFAAVAKLLAGKEAATPDRLAKDRKLLGPLGMVGIPLCLSFSGGVGALFGVVGARPYWNSSLMPLLFLCGALASGGALVAFAFTAFTEDRKSPAFLDLTRLLANVVLGFLTLYVVFEWAEFSINLYSAVPAESDAYRLVLFGPFWWVFWLVHVGLGVVVPLAILAPAGNRTDPSKVALAAGLVVVTFLAVRVNIVVPGLALEELHGLKNAYRDARLNFDYFPNLWEWGVTAFSYSLVALFFYVGCKNLPLLGPGAGTREGGAR